jgi:hypothetical protein
VISLRKILKSERGKWTRGAKALRIKALYC